LAWQIMSRIFLGVNKMAELTINQVIKIAIGVFVVAIVIFGVTMSFKNYIIPYFQGVGNFTG